MEIGWKASGRRTTSGSLVLKGAPSGQGGGRLPETNRNAPHTKRKQILREIPLISGKSRLVVASWKMEISNLQWSTFQILVSGSISRGVFHK